MKTTPTFVFAVVLVAVGFAMPRSASAQSYTYQPSRPTFSPYFSYFQVNTTGLPDYQTFIQPQRQLRAQIQREQNRLRSVERTQLSLQREATRLRLGSMIREDPNARRVVPAARFLNYSGFFPDQNSVRQRR